jgi:leucyl aminopeptidase
MLTSPLAAVWTIHMPGHALLDAPAAASVTVVALTKRQYEGWHGAQSAAVRAWLEETRFRAEVSSLAWLPKDSDAPARLLVIVGDEPLTALADLPYRLPEGDYQLESEWQGAALELALLGWGLGAYRFTRYKQPERAPARLFGTQHLADVAQQLDAIALVRDLINMPAADMLPSDLAAAAQQLAAEFGASCDITLGDDLLTHNHPTIHAVGRASANAPRLIDIRWGQPTHPRLVLVGKGVCFDSGGLDLKGAANMRYMKKDMGGAAHALGLARLVMANSLPVNLRVLVPAVENAVAGNAFRPGDIIRTRKGATVEIDNTDAEGRLVLCDALTAACEEAPALIIDFATLTGAARTALGTEVPAMFCNDDELARGIERAASAVADPIWRLPLHQPYRKMLDSKAADMVNSASSPYGGAIVAALFLEAFVTSGIPWVHFDVMAWNTSSQPGRPEGGEAMGLRAVYAHLADRFKG